MAAMPGRERQTKTMGDDNVFIDDENSTLYAVWRQMILDVDVYKYGQQQTGTDAPLPGAGFKLTKQSVSTSTESTATSASNGQVRFENIVLPIGATLTLNETSVPAGTEYKLITEDITITYEAEVDAETGDYVFKTVDGVEYISAVVKTITCVNGSVITQEDLDGDGTKEWVIHNKLNMVPIRIVKTDEKGDPLGEVEFSLVGGDLNLTGLISDANNNGIVTQTIGSGDSATTVTVFDLEMDTPYVLTETGPLANYAGLAGTVTLTPSASGITLSCQNPAGSSLITASDSPDTGGVYTVTVKNNKKTIPLKVVKIDQSGQPLAGATFTGDLIDGGSVTTEITGEGKDAEAIIINNEAVPIGVYTITETGVPPGYYPLEGDVVITVANNTAGTDIVVSGTIGETPISNNYITRDTQTGLWTVKIMNSSGVALPNSGGSGTRLVYLLGFMLMSFAGAILMMRRRGDS